jgi:medium-chain acyl-[acyl-carrier-protein] hydrolase
MSRPWELQKTQPFIFYVFPEDKQEGRTMPGKRLEKEYEIHYYEVDYKKRALITSLVNYFEDIATCQSEELGVGMTYLLEKGWAWVLYKWDIKVERYPLYGEKVIVKTFPYSFKKFYAYRKFEICDSQGERVAYADSMWFLIHMEKRRPIRVAEDIYRAYGIPPEENFSLEMEDITPPKKPEKELHFNVRYSDIDTNLHVNNVKYLDWMIETVPREIVMNYTLKNIKITYQKETRYGEEIRVCTEIVEEGEIRQCLHKIVDSEGNELTLGKTTWAFGPIDGKEE